MSLQDYDSFSLKEKEHLTTIINKLISGVYIYKEVASTDYYYILTNFDFLKLYFDIAKMELIKDPIMETIYLLPYNDNTRYHFNLLETTLLLILRLKYEEQLTSPTRGDKICCSVRDVQEKYSLLKIKSNPIEKQVLLRFFNMLKRYNIIQFIQDDHDFASSLIVMNPPLLLIIRVENINSIIDKITALNKKEDNDVLSDETETD